MRKTYRIFLWLVLWLMLGLIFLSSPGCRKKNPTEIVPQAGNEEVVLAGQEMVSTPKPVRIEEVIQRTAPPRMDKSENQPSPAINSSGGDAVRSRIFQLKVPDEVANLHLDKTGNNYTFLVEKSQPVLPLDYKIGPLQDLATTQREVRQVADRLRSFLDGLQKGTILKDYLWEESIKSLSNFLEYNVIKKKHQPRDYRIGRIEIEQGTATGNVRLWGALGSSEGEIYLKLGEGQWFVSDLQLNFEPLDLETPVEQEVFNPSRYYWELQ